MKKVSNYERVWKGLYKITTFSFSKKNPILALSLFTIFTLYIGYSNKYSMGGFVAVMGLIIGYLIGKKIYEYKKNKEK